MAITQIAEIYEAEYRYGDPNTAPPLTPPGWFDAQRTVTAWFDDEWVLKVERIPLQLVIANAGLLLDGADEFFPWTVTVIVLPSLFVDDDVIFHPIALRKLDPPDRFMKNEVIRRR